MLISSGPVPTPAPACPVLNAAHPFVRVQLAVITQIHQVDIECVGRISIHRQIGNVGAPVLIGWLKADLRFVRQVGDLRQEQMVREIAKLSNVKARPLFSSLKAF